MDIHELRAWAVEQAIKLHGPNGVTTMGVIGEARKLMAFVVEDAPEATKPLQPPAAA